MLVLFINYKSCLYSVMNLYYLISFVLSSEQERCWDVFFVMASSPFIKYSYFLCAWSCLENMFVFLSKSYSNMFSFILCVYYCLL